LALLGAWTLWWEIQYNEQIFHRIGVWILSPLIRVNRNTCLKISCSRYDEHFSVSGLNCKEWLLRECDTVYRQVFTSSCINIGGNINNEMTHSQIKPPLQLQLCLTNPGRKNTLIRFRHLMISTIVLISTPCSQYIQGLDLKIASILHTRFSLIYIYIRCLLTYSLFLRPATNKEKQMVHSVVKCSFTYCKKF